MQRTFTKHTTLYTRTNTRTSWQRNVRILALWYQQSHVPRAFLRIYLVRFVVVFTRSSTQRCTHTRTHAPSGQRANSHIHTQMTHTRIYRGKTLAKTRRTKHEQRLEADPKHKTRATTRRTKHEQIPEGQNMSNDPKHKT